MSNIDLAGMMIECTARNISLKELATYLNVTEDYLTTKLVCPELLNIEEGIKIKDLLRLHGSSITMDSLFFNEEEKRGQTEYEK